MRVLLLILSAALIGCAAKAKRPTQRVYVDKTQTFKPDPRKVSTARRQLWELFNCNGLTWETRDKARGN